VKKFLIVSLVILFAVAVLPQRAAAGVGVKGGYAMSTLAMTPASSIPLVNLKAPVGGVFFGIGLGLFSIQPEILYVRMGTRIQAEGSPDWMEIRLDYIQVPVLLKINVLPGPISPMIYGGPYGAFRFAAKGAISGVSGTADIGDAYTTTDYGVVFGGGIDFRLPVIKLSAEARYNLGLSNIAKDPAPGVSTKNKSLMVLVGIGF
jgi:hypothetical protein